MLRCLEEMAVLRYELDTVSKATTTKSPLERFFRPDFIYSRLVGESFDLRRSVWQMIAPGDGLQAGAGQLGDANTPGSNLTRLGPFIDNFLLGSNIDDIFS